MIRVWIIEVQISESAPYNETALNKPRQQFETKLVFFFLDAEQDQLRLKER